MLQNYLQGFIRHLSSVSFTFLNTDIPVVLVLGAAILASLGVFYRKRITKKHLVLFLLVILLMFFGLIISDYYIDYNFYDIQNNWHYFAYGIFSFIVYSHYKLRSVPMHKINFYTFFLAGALSLFDECFQFFMSQRIFDPSDVAKDLWGVVIGLMILNFGVERQEINWSILKIRKNKLREYYKDPVSGFILLLIFSYCFLFVSSLLTEAKYFVYILLISLLIFSLLFFIIHLYKDEFKRIFQVILTIIIALQVILFVSNFNRDIVRHNNFLTVYKGIPLLFFDVLFYPDQTFRFVDKKTEFNKTDKELLLKYEPDIILIGGKKQITFYLQCHI